MFKYLCFLIAFTSINSWGQVDYGYLKASDQKYYKNDSMEGNNQFERIDMNVKEINKLHGEVATLKAELQKLRSEVEILKAKKP